MENKNEYFLLNNLMTIIFLIKTPKTSLINLLKNRTIYNDKPKTEERKIILINYLSNKYPPLNTNEIIENKLIFVEPIKSWEKYGIKKNAHSLALFHELMNISINNNYFSYNEKTNKFILNMIKSRIKKIKEIGGSTFCSLFFNKELNKMIAVSVGNILYSILRENKSRKYEIIYISTEQYHDINIPYQISSLNNDYNNMIIQYHNININDIIIISNKKEIILEYNNYINLNKDINNKKNDEKLRNVYLYKYKIINKTKDSEINNDNMSSFSTSLES
jgi:hypothetical protein